MSKDFKKPKITINRVYTRKGDKGYTMLIGGEKVKKNSNRINGFGEIDELNVAVGSCGTALDELDTKNRKEINSMILIIQNNLFNLGNMIATPNDCINSEMPRITKESIKYLEDQINKYNDQLNPLSSFVLPGGNEINIRFHFARVICRRCERNIVGLIDIEKLDTIIVQYLNRLSDLLFILSRYANKILSNKESLWDPNFK